MSDEVTIVKKGKKLVAGVSSISRSVNESVELNYNRDNRFSKYQYLSTVSPHVFIPLIKLSLTIIKGFRIVSDNQAKKKNYEDWAKAIDLRNKIQMLALLLMRDGTYVATITDSSKSLFNFEPVMMEYLSILPEGFDATNNTIVLTPPIEKFVINEGIVVNPETIDRDKVIYGAIYPRIKRVKDNQGRDTFGLYGQSLMDSVDDLIEKYLDVIEGYSSYVKKYGYGRYHFDYEALEEFIREGDIESATEALDKLSEEHSLIEENEDIVGAGFKIKELNTGGSNISVTQWKESLEKDIQIGLFQAPLTMGRAEGTTFASGYISEEDRMIALEGIQNIIREIVNNEIIRRREGIALGMPLDVSIEFEELSKPKVEVKDMIAMYDKGLISQEQLRARTGFPIEKDPSGTYVIQPDPNKENDLNDSKITLNDDQKEQKDKQPLNKQENNQ